MGFADYSQGMRNGGCGHDGVGNRAPVADTIPALRVGCSMGIKSDRNSCFSFWGSSYCKPSSVPYLCRHTLCSRAPDEQLQQAAISHDFRWSSSSWGSWQLIHFNNSWHMHDSCWMGNITETHCSLWKWRLAAQQLALSLHFLQAN